MHLRSSILAVLLTVANVAGAQMSAADHIVIGDKEHTAMNAPAALAHYEAAIAVDPKNYESLWKAAREAVDVGEYTMDEKARTALFKKGLGYATRAIDANKDDAEGHFHMARSLGRTALKMGTKDRIRLAGDIRAQALDALKFNPAHPGAMHVMGMWNAEIMRLSGISRFMAKNFLGGQIFGSANWTDAVKYMEKSRDADPTRIVHRLDLARIYNDVGNTVNAKAEYQNVLSMAATDYNDRHYKVEAAAEVKKIK